MNPLRSLATAALVALILTSLAVPTFAESVNYEMVTVGDAGNAADMTGYGAVNYDYQIGKYEVTIGQYTEFLNAVDPNGTNPLGLYSNSMGTDGNITGILYSSGSASGQKYSPIGSAARPITYVSWFDAARFANWMQNGQGSGSTETGAYTMSTGQITAASRTGGVNTYTLAAPSALSVGDQVAVTGLVGTAFNVRGVVTSVSGSQFTMANSNSDAVATGTGSMTGASATAAGSAQFYIPTENESYKAAYYSPLLNSGSGGYWTYATQSNDAPGNTIGSGTNQANYRSSLSGTAVYSVTQFSSYSSSQNYLTDVGAFANSASYYGTFDQLGNVSEFTDTASNPYDPLSELRKRFGCGWECLADKIEGKLVEHIDPLHESATLGFRLAAPAVVPEPPTYAMALAGIACGGFSMWRRRKRA